MEGQEVSPVLPSLRSEPTGDNDEEDDGEGEVEDEGILEHAVDEVHGGWEEVGDCGRWQGAPTLRRRHLTPPIILTISPFTALCSVIYTTICFPIVLLAFCTFTGYLPWYMTHLEKA